MISILIFAFTLSSKFEKPSDILLHIQFMFPILPMLVLYSMADYPREYLYFTSELSVPIEKRFITVCWVLYTFPTIQQKDKTAVFKHSYFSG